MIDAEAGACGGAAFLNTAGNIRPSLRIMIAVFVPRLLQPKFDGRTNNRKRLPQPDPQRRRGR
jgi:hypothetical protein